MTIKQLRTLLKTQPIFAENDRFALKGMTEQDEEQFFRVIRETTAVPELFRSERVNQLTWEALMESERIMPLAIVEKATGQYMGECILQSHEGGIEDQKGDQTGDKTEVEMEIGIDLAKQYQGRGIGKIVMALLIEKVREVFLSPRIIAKVSADNSHSEQMIKSLGGILLRKESGKESGKEPGEINVFEMPAIPSIH